MGPGAGSSALQPQGPKHIPVVHYGQVDIHTASAGGGTASQPGPMVWRGLGELGGSLV